MFAEWLSLLPEVGQMALIIACGFALVLFLFPLWGSFTGNRLFMLSARSFSAGFFVFVLISYCCLTYSFITNDFSVRYVATNSNSLLPLQYRISAVWGGHEGSLLLWILMLSGWTFAVAIFSRSLPLQLQSRVLSIMGFIAIGFSLFILITSNPFERNLPIPPSDGGDLNPLLQDFGLIVHPPVLYMGYVGFSVAFAFAIAALITGRMDAAWARWSRPWATIAWGFLSLGVALGSWWAYYELGWGGWWFWDPVENAAFMPWLAGTALIHSLAVTEKRSLFKSWTILLAIFAFSLSLLGTFLVRSGVLTSVHAFASDPERGMFILGFLFVVVGFSLVLYAFRAPVVKSEQGFDWFSRETFLLGNNILLIVVLLVVLTGTLYPLIADALGYGKVSVGPPFFNLFFLPIMGLLCVLLAIGPLLNWKKTSFKLLLDLLKKPLVFSLIIGLAFPLVIGGGYSLAVVVAVFIAVWIASALVSDVFYRLRHATSYADGFKKLSLSYYAMCLAHLGVAVSLIGIVLSSVYSHERDLRLSVGDSVNIAPYQFTLQSLNTIEKDNYRAEQANIEITKNGKFLEILTPQKRQYLATGRTMTEVALDPGLMRDLYIAMGEKLDENSWAMRVHVKPFVRWIWLGAILMALGSILAVIDKRYRKIGGAANE